MTVFHGRTTCIAVQVGFAHLKSLYVEDLLYLLELIFLHHTINV